MTDYPEHVGKMVKRITASNDEDWRNICIDFTDGTSLGFTMDLRLTMQPETFRVRDGNVPTKSIRKYKPVR